MVERKRVIQFGKNFEEIQYQLIINTMRDYPQLPNHSNHQICTSSLLYSIFEKLPNQLSLYEQALCLFMQQIEESVGVKSDLNILSHQLYLKSVLDGVLLREQKGSSCTDIQFNNVLSLTAKIFNEETKQYILQTLQENSEPLANTKSNQTIYQALSFLDFKHKFQLIVSSLTVHLSPHQLEIGLAVLTYALTKSQFYSFNYEQMLKGCLAWLINREGINFRMDVCSGLFAKNLRDALPLFEVMLANIDELE